MIKLEAGLQGGDNAMNGLNHGEINVHIQGGELSKKQ
jgi:hypothetical protein